MSAEPSPLKLSKPYLLMKTVMEEKEAVSGPSFDFQCWIFDFIKSACIFMGQHFTSNHTLNLTCFKT